MFAAELTEELEDSEGNVYNRKVRSLLLSLSAVLMRLSARRHGTTVRILPTATAPDLVLTLCFLLVKRQGLL